MLELNSERWRHLKVPTGDARNIPGLIQAFRATPGIDAFDNFFDELTGVGDLAVHDGFYAALPHAVEMIGLLQGEEFETALAQLGWGVALSAEDSPTVEFAADFDQAKRGIARLASENLQSGGSGKNREWMEAALAAGLGDHEKALEIIDAI